MEPNRVNITQENKALGAMQNHPEYLLQETPRFWGSGERPPSKKLSGSVTQAAAPLAQPSSIQQKNHVQWTGGW